MLDPGQYEEFGIYAQTAQNHHVIEQEVPLRTEVFNKPALVKRNRSIGEHFQNVWAVVAWRRTSKTIDYGQHPRMPPEQVYLAELC